VLRTEEQECAFAPTQGETVGEFFARLHDEAAQLAAAWFFVAMLTPASPPEQTGAVPGLDPLDGSSVRAALKRGDLRTAVGWYAECRATPQPIVRCGIWHLAEDRTIDGHLEASADSIVPLFRSVLAQ
jgi:hypothetical protein